MRSDTAVLTVLASLMDSQESRRTVPDAIEQALEAVRDVLDCENRPDHKRSWLLLSLMTAVIRGILADNLVTDPRGFRAINDEDFNDWIQRHGAHPDVLDFALVRGLYDLVFGYIDADPERPSFGAGLAVFLTGLVLFQYKGAIFWKMTAGMGDVIIAPRLSSAAPARRRLRILSPPGRAAPRREPSSHRRRHRGPSSQAGRRPRPL